METYPVRPSIYHPQSLLGIRLSDWPWIMGLGLLSVSLPFFGEWKLGPVPLAIPLGAAGIISSVTFFKWAQTGRRPRWLEFRLKALTSPQVQGRHRYGQRRRQSYLRPEMKKN